MASTKREQSKLWVFTAFEESWDGLTTVSNLDNSPTTFWCYGREECPETKRKHWQGYMEFSKNMSLRMLKKTFPKAIHWERRQGSQAQAIAYCQKDGDFYTFGDRADSTGAGRRTDLESIRAEIADGTPVSEIADKYFAKWCQYGRAFAKYAMLKQPDRSWETEVHVLWGPTGTGKTRKAVDAGARLIEIDRNGFAHGYENQPTILLDDFDPSTLTRSEFLRLTDRYPTTVNVKNGSAKWNPRVIYITTNYSPRDWYGACPAIRRRFTSITHVNTPMAGSSSSSASAAAEQVATFDPKGASTATNEHDADSDDDLAMAGERYIVGNKRVGCLVCGKQDCEGWCGFAK